jgi:hypothetical protein
LVYFYHFQNPEIPIKANFTLDLKKPGLVTWVSPETGESLSESKFVPGRYGLWTPEFSADIALKVNYDKEK